MSAPEQRWVLVPHSLTEDMGRAICTLAINGRGRMLLRQFGAG